MRGAAEEGKGGGDAGRFTPATTSLRRRRGAVWAEVQSALEELVLLPAARSFPLACFPAHFFPPVRHLSASFWALFSLAYVSPEYYPRLHAFEILFLFSFLLRCFPRAFCGILSCFLSKIFPLAVCFL